MSWRFHRRRASFPDISTSQGVGLTKIPQFGMFSLLIREKVNNTALWGPLLLLSPSQLYIGEAIWAFLFGIIIGTPQNVVIAPLLMWFCCSLGPYGAHIFSPRDWGGSEAHSVTDAITLEVTRVVLAIGVFAIGVELPSKYMKKHAKSLLFL